MSFLSPIHFMFSFFLIPIILLHLLKKKYIATNISSTFLWNKQIKNIEVNKSFEKIKKWLLLILQLLIIISLIMFLVKPYIKGNDNKEIINILIDNSASMEENIEQVKKDTIKLVNSFSENTLINIYTYNKNKEFIISSFSKKQVISEIRNIKLTLKKDDLSLVLNTFDNKKDEDYYIFTDRFIKINQDNIYFQIYESSNF
ncbi:MAG: BatA domain-containing protein, partial [Bacillota bacterium]|nr:BatA domain-containing protein [Bacillota bacterium]